MQFWRMVKPDHMLGGVSACLGSNPSMVWKSPLWLVSLLRHWMRRQGVDLSRPEDLLVYLYNKSQNLFLQTRRTRLWMQSTLIWRGGILMRRWWGNLACLTYSYSDGKIFHVTFLDASGFISRKPPFHTRPWSVSMGPEMSSKPFIPYSSSVVCSRRLATSAS